MPNHYVNKVQRVVNGETETIIDITSDTVSAENLAIGYTAHAANGAPVVGTLNVPPDMVVLSYGTSTWADFTDAYSTNSIVYCRASSNGNPATGTQNRMAAMAYVDDSASPEYVEFQYYYPIANHTAAQQGDQVFIYKLDSTNSWTVAVQDIYTLPTMSATVKGGAKLGAGLSVADDTLSLSGESYTSAEKTKLAGIEANANNYTLPTMGATTKGGAKLGDGLSVANDVLSVDVSDVASGQLPIAHGGTGASTAAAALTALGAASQDDMDDAEQAIADNAAAIATLGESVSPSTITQKIMIITPCRAPNPTALWMTIPIPPGHSSVSVTNIPANFDVIPMYATGTTGTTITVTGFESAQISGAALNLRFKVTGATVGNYLTVSTREITLTFS